MGKVESFDITLLPESILTSEIKQDIVEAIVFLDLRFNQHYTMEQCGEEFGVTTRQSMYNRLWKWKKNGAWQKAEEVILLPKIVEAKLANQKVIAAWPEVIERQLDIAIHGRSDKNATESAIFLKEQIYDPIMNEVQEPGSAEKAYADRPADSAPDQITLPAKMVKKVP